MLVDSHCHLTFPDFKEDLPDIFARAKGADVGLMLTISTKIAEAPLVQGLADAHEQIFCTVGVHPHEAETDSDVTAAQLVELARHHKTVGIGETGLDYFYEHSPREEQRNAFRAHIGAARETQLPLIVHARDADDEIVDILRDEYKKGAFPGLIHCFSSGRGLAEAALEMGFYISLSGILTFKTAHELRDIASDVPLDRLLVETDAPYLAPVPKRGKRNEPSFVAHTAQCLADLKGVSAEELAAVTTENFFRLFTKVPESAAA